MKHKTDVMRVLFDDRSRSILYSLVHRDDSNGLAAGNDATFEPTISAVFSLYSEIAERNTPDLFEFEWQMIVKSLKPNQGIYQMPDTVERLKARLVISLEDMDNTESELIEAQQLANKIAGLSDLNICGIYYHAQKYLVARHRNEIFDFPKIKFKG
jgi:hypothetical protein